MIVFPSLIPVILKEDAPWMLVNIINAERSAPFGASVALRSSDSPMRNRTAADESVLCMAGLLLVNLSSVRLTVRRTVLLVVQRTGCPGAQQGEGSCGFLKVSVPLSEAILVPSVASSLEKASGFQHVVKSKH